MDVRPATELAPPPSTGEGRAGRGQRWTRPGNGRFRAGVLGVGALAVLAYLPHLTTSTVLIDERVYVEAGQQYLDGDFGTNREHPPLAKLLFGVAGRVVGDPVLGGRLVAVVAGLAIAVAVFVLVRRMAGRAWGLGAAGLWVVLPHALRHAELGWGGFDRLDRYAMLDPVATAFAVWALVVALRWSDDERLRWGVLAGALVGLAAGAKLSGGLVGPVVAAVPWVAASGRGRSATSWWHAVLASATVGLVALAGLALAYVRSAHRPSRCGGSWSTSRAPMPPAGTVSWSRARPTRTPRGGPRPGTAGGTRAPW